MVDPVEAAGEQMNEAREKQGDKDRWPVWMAMVVSFLAASLALADIGAKSSQTAFLTYHINASDIWNFYQAKNLRSSLWSAQGELLKSLPNAESAAIQERIKTALTEEARLRDEPATGEGMKQLEAKAKKKQLERDDALEAYHGYEHTSGALEIAIVLASVSVVTRIRALGFAAGGIGLAACVYGVAVYAHLA
jgi:hypothetical protein